MRKYPINMSDIDISNIMYDSHRYYIPETVSIEVDELFDMAKELSYQERHNLMEAVFQTLVVKRVDNYGVRAEAKHFNRIIGKIKDDIDSYNAELAKRAYGSYCSVEARHNRYPKDFDLWFAQWLK